MLKNCSDSIIPLHIKIINLAISTGNYLNGLKISKITSIHKSNSKTDPSNYRPESILPIINKVFELKWRLIKFLTKSNFLYEHQYGFRASFCTETATFELINKINSAIDSKTIVNGLFLDLSKAFDCVNHKILLAKLEFAGIRGVALELFRCYLTNRQQFVKIDDVVSELRPISIGIP